MVVHPNDALNKNMMRYPLGSVEWLADGKADLSFVREYAFGPSAVWAQLSDPELTQQWWAKTRGTMRAGSSWDLKWLNAKVQDGGHELDWWNGKVRECVPEQVLELENSMHGSLRFELAPAQVGPVQDGTRLTFHNTIEAPVEVALMSLAGWHVHLDHLQESLSGKAVDWPRWWDDFYPSWEQVHAAYQEKLT